MERSSVPVCWFDESCHRCGSWEDAAIYTIYKRKSYSAVVVSGAREVNLLAITVRLHRRSFLM